VALLYCVEGGLVEMTEALVVADVQPASLTLTVPTHARPGMSGGALVSLRDFALLGTYVGSNATLAECNKFTAEMRFNLMEASRVREEIAVTRENFLREMEKRGLGQHVKRALKSLVPVYSDGQFLGTTAVVGDKLRSTFRMLGPVELIGFSGSDVFVEVEKGAYETGAAGRTGITATRRPRVDDRVVLLGLDKTSAFLSDVVAVHATPDSSHFFVMCDEKFDSVCNLRGAVVLSVIDGAVIGQCVDVRTSMTHGNVFDCMKFPTPLPDVQTDGLVNVLRGMFPSARVDTWDLDEVMAAIGHSSYDSDARDSMANYAAIGDSEARTAMWRHLRAERIPHNEWQVRLSRTQSNASFQAIGQKYGVLKYVRRGKGVTLSYGTKVVGEVVEALIGYLSQKEDSSVLASACEHLGLFG